MHYTIPFSAMVFTKEVICRFCWISAVNVALRPFAGKPVIEPNNSLIVILFPSNYRSTEIQKKISGLPDKYYLPVIKNVAVFANNCFNV
jgi:hypothetical protein